MSTDLAWIDAALTSARPQAVGALLRYFRDLDTAEEAYQDACLRALKAWPQNGAPRDPAAWLIMVGRNAALDAKRKTIRLDELPDEAVLSDLDDVENLDEALAIARELGEANPGGSYEIRPVRLFLPGAFEAAATPEAAEA